MQNGRYSGGLFSGDEELGHVDFPDKDYLTYEEIFKLYNDKIIIDRNGLRMLVKDGKFKFPKNEYSYKKLSNRIPRYRKELIINQILWNWETMSNSIYSGGVFTGMEK